MNVASAIAPTNLVDWLRARSEIVLTAAVVLTAIVAMGVGAMPLTVAEVVSALLQPLGLGAAVDPQTFAVVWSIRLPRVVLGALVGSTLGVAGAAMQGLFRNPLADPGLLGVQSGAALAAVTVIVLGNRLLGHFPAALAPYVLPVASFLGGLAMTLAVMRLGRSNRLTVVYLMLLAGVALSALAGAFMGFLMFMADDTQLRTMTFWTLGSVGGASWSLIFPVAPILLIAPLLLPRAGRALDLLAMGEAEARHAGLDVESFKRRLILVIALVVGAAVSVSGMIGFIGLLVPHLLRMVIGPSHGRLLRTSAVAGALVLMGADLVARVVVVPAELPVGVVTAFAGAPFLLWLLMRDRSLRMGT